MDKVIVNIGDKTYKCKVARTEEEQRKGLMGVENLPEDEGMLFVWDKEETHYMWMKNCSIPLDQIGINEDEEVTIVYPAEPNNETQIPFAKTKYILEVNKGSGIEEGDELDIEGLEEDDNSEYTMKVLDPNGDVQMKLKGGERIFRRIFTKQLIRWVKKAELAKNDESAYNKYCKRIGSLMFKELKAQNEREPEYVELPN